MAADRTPQAKPRMWQRMLSGRRLDLAAPDPADIEISDVARGLARLARWNGQTLGEHPFSVAQHALLVEEIVAARGPDPGPSLRLAALLHDAPEFVIGDLISPFKAAIGLDYRAFEARLLAAIHRRFGLPADLPPELTATIKAADRISAYFEATRLAGFEATEAELYFGRPPALPAPLNRRLDALTGEPSPVVEARYASRLTELSSALRAGQGGCG